MRIIIFCFAIFIHLNLLSQKVVINNLIDSIRDNRIKIEELKGGFSFYKSDYKSNIFKSEYIFENKANETKLKIYYSSSDSGEIITINKESFKLENQYDVLSCKLYKLDYNNEMLCLIGQSSSASGSGVQIAYYTLFSKEKGIYILKNEFSTRFGEVNNLGDFNNDKNVDLIAIKRVNKYFKLFISNLKDEDLGLGYIQLRYLGNNEFIIMLDCLKAPLSHRLQ